MNIFQRIKEVKLPFFAVIAALVFGGVVAPANAAVPSATNFTTTNLTFSGATVSFDMSVASSSGVGCKAMARAASATAPTVAYILAATTYDSANGDLTSFTSNVSNLNAVTTGSISFSGLPAGTSFVVYVACQDGASQSTLFTHTFTTTAVATLLTPATFSGTVSAGQTLTATAATYSTQGATNKWWIFCTNSHAPATGLAVNAVLQDCAPMFDSLNSHNSYRSNPTQTPLTFVIPNDGNVIDFNGASVSITGKHITFYETFYVTYSGARSTAQTVQYGGGSSSSQQAPTTAAVQRPLPKISFATNPAPGFSVRPTSDTRKGTLTLQGENFSDLTAITIAGKKADFTVKDGKLEIKLPAGVTGFPEVVMTNASGSITMQNAIEIVENKVQKLTRFVGDRFTKAGLEVLENALIEHKESTSIEAIVVVAADATEADYANAVKAATDAATYLDKVSKRISHTSVTVVKTGAAGSKPTVEMNFTKQ